MVTHHTTDQFCTKKKTKKIPEVHQETRKTHIFLFKKTTLAAMMPHTHKHTHTCTHMRTHTHTHTYTRAHVYKYMNGNVWLKHIRLCPCSTGHAVILSYIIKPEFPECTHTYRETYFRKYMHGNVWLKHIRLCPCSTDHAVILSYIMKPEFPEWTRT